MAPIRKKGGGRQREAQQKSGVEFNSLAARKTGPKVLPGGRTPHTKKKIGEKGLCVQVLNTRRRKDLTAENRTGGVGVTLGSAFSKTSGKK